MNNNNSLFTENEYYIHGHQESLKKINLKGKVESIYNIRKKEIQREVLQEWKEKILPTGILDENTFNTLDNAMSISEEEMLDLVNEALDEKIKKSIDMSSLNEKEEALFKEAKRVNDAIDNIVNKRNALEFNELLEAISEVIKLIDNSDGSLGAVLENHKFNTKSGGSLLKVLREWEKTNEGKMFTAGEYKNAYNKVKSFASFVKNKKFINRASKGDFKKGLKTLLLDGLISTDLSEVLTAKSREIVDNNINDALYELTGTDTVEIEDFGYKRNITSIIGKTDVTLKNINFRTNVNDDEIKIDIGISNKFYTGKNIKDLHDFGSMIISSGSGGSLRNALQNIGVNNNDTSYLANAVAWEESNEMINDLLIQKNFIRSFASAGLGDKAQYMIVNGKIVSLYQVLKFIQSDSNSFGKSRSMGGSSQGIYLTITGRKNFINAAQTWLYVPGTKNSHAKVRNIQKAKERSHLANLAMDSARVKMEMHVGKMLTMAGKTFIN